MISKFILSVFIVFLANQCALAEDRVKKYEIDAPTIVSNGKHDFPLGIGSGLEFSQELPNGDLEFFLLTDRGPNFGIDNDEKLVVFCPEFTPKILKVRLTKDGKSEIYNYLNIDKSISVNMKKIPKQDKLQVVNEYLEPMDVPLCIDTESIAILDEDTFIVGDEYGPRIYFIDRKTGKSRRSLKPGKGLPDIFKDRSSNRGIEALTVAPNGNIYAALEGTLDLQGQTNKSAKLIRFVEINPINNKTRSFAYEFTGSSYIDSSVVKIGDMDAIDNDNFLIIEQGKQKDGSMQNLIYKINIKDATDISEMKLDDGSELEYASNLEDLKNIKFIKKEVLLNPREFGWIHNKVEGVAFIDDHRLAISNDNDFGIEDYQKEEIDCQNSSSKERSCQKIIPVMTSNGNKTSLWVFELDKKI